MNVPQHQDRCGEDGAIVALLVVLLVVLLGLSAIVADLGFLYVDRQQSKAIADMAATAGALGLEPTTGGSPQEGCERAWGYLRINTDGIPDDEPSPCDAFASMTFCDGTTTPVTATKDVGPYTASITIPVADGSSLMQGRLDADLDGDPCERVGVHLTRTRSYIFAVALGHEGGETSTGSVARSTTQTTGGDLVSLVVLERHDCGALIAMGQAQVLVKAVYHDDTGTWAPGIITSDSSGTGDCTPPGQPYTIDATGTQNSKIEAEATPDGSPGIIFSHALLNGNSPTTAYDPTDVPTRLTPRPVGGDRLTRAPVDHRYNCKSSYPDPLIPACPTAGPGSAHIDELRQSVGASGQPAGFADFNDYVTTTYGIADPCKLSTSAPAITMPAGDWWVNCPSATSSEKGIEIQSSVTFLDGNVVFEGEVRVFGTLSINGSAGNDSAFVYVRRDDLLKDSQAAVTLDHVFVYLHDGELRFGAGSPPLVWIAPDDETYVFDDLALWSESPGLHELGGQATLEIEGAFFTPNAAPFEFTGQGDQQQTKAQFISRRLVLKGQGQLIMQPDPDRVITFSLQGVGLIR